MKNAIKVLCFVLAVIIIGTSGVYLYFTWDKKSFDYIDGVDKGTVKITGYKGDAVNVVIPDRLRGKKVVAVEEKAFSGTDIETVKLNRYITTVGKNAFLDCEKLKRADLGKNLKSLGESAFTNCTSLEEVVISPKLEKIGPFAFGNSAKLDSLDFSGNDFFTFENGILFDKDKTKIYQALASADLSEVIIPGTVTEIESYAFNTHNELTKLIIPEGILKIGTGAFVNCSALSEIVLPESLRVIGSAVFTGTALKSLTLPSGLTNIDKTFAYGSEKNITFTVTKGSYAEKFVKTNNLNYTVK